MSIEKFTPNTMNIEQHLLEFIDWKDSLKTISTPLGILYDAKPHYKYLNEHESIYKKILPC